MRLTRVFRIHWAVCAILVSFAWSCMCLQELGKVQATCDNFSCLCTWENGNLGGINGGHGGHSGKRHTFKHRHTGVHGRYHSSRPLHVNLGGHWETEELSEPCCPMSRLTQDVIVPSPVPQISPLLAAFRGHSSGEEPIKTCPPELPQKPCTCKYGTSFMSCWRVEWPLTLALHSQLLIPSAFPLWRWHLSE